MDGREGRPPSESQWHREVEGGLVNRKHCSRCDLVAVAGLECTVERGGSGGKKARMWSQQVEESDRPNMNRKLATDGFSQSNA